MNLNYRNTIWLFALVISASLLTGCTKANYILTSNQNQQYQLKEGAVEDMSIDSFVKPYRDSLDKKVNTVLAKAESELTVGKRGSDLFPTQVAMGNFVTDAIMSIARQKATELKKPSPEIAFFTWGSLRKSLPAGDLTLRNIYELMPFENEMVVLKLSGAQVNTLLTRLAFSYNPINGVAMSQSDPSSILINGKPLNQEQSYYILSSDYHAFGGDNLTVLTEASESYYSGIKMRDAIALYLQQLTAKNQTLKPNYELRIKN